MNKLEETIAQVRMIFNSNQTLYLWVMHYGISHQHMRVAIYQDNFFKRTEIICGDCFYFAGLTKGGPYKLEISQSLNMETHESIISITGNESGLVIKCSDISIVSDWRVFLTPM